MKYSIVFAVLLMMNVAKSQIDKKFVLTAIVLDLLWVLGSTILLVGDFLSLSITGKWIIFGLAVAVLDFAIFQFLGYRKIKNI